MFVVHIPAAIDDSNGVKSHLDADQSGGQCDRPDNQHDTEQIKRSDRV